MPSFQPPPTYANPVIVNEQTKQATFNPIWLKWFVDIAAFISEGGTGGGSLGTGEFVRQDSPTINNPDLVSPDINSATGDSLSLSGALSAASGAISGAITTASLTASGTVAAAILQAAGPTSLIRSASSLNNGAGAAAGTLANAPSAGNPTKWIPIDDNGTTRYIPTWQ